jgi:hypothetical protein
MRGVWGVRPEGVPLTHHPVRRGSQHQWLEGDGIQGEDAGSPKAPK